MTDKTDDWYLRRGVELAGWNYGNMSGLCTLPTGQIANLDFQWVKDAVAAQLARQVSRVPDHILQMSIDNTTMVYGRHTKASCTGCGWAMNTIRVVVDSEVLE
jgi:hypothetical protein